MALISRSIPNFVNGVSQQPPAFRLTTQAELQENGLSSVVDGLSKRPCTEHIAYLGNITGLDSAFIHTSRRDELEAYYIIVYKEGTTGKIKVFDQNGVAKTVTIASTSAQNYIDNLANPKENLSAVSIADYTYILNKEKVVAKSSTKTAQIKKEGLVYVKDCDYSSTFRIQITKGSETKYLEFKTRSATQSDTATVQLVEKGTNTDVIANHFYDFFRNAFSTSSYYDSYSYTSAGLPSGMGVSLTGSVLYFYNSSTSDTTDFTVTVVDSNGGEHLKPFKDKTADFKKLPPMAPSGFKIMVNGDNDKGQDDYWVQYNSDVWKETVAPNVEYIIDAATMPMTLRKDTSGVFHFEESKWANRKCGDDSTNPFPSFIGYKITDIFFFKNRLGLLADENVIFARSGEFEYYDFFRKTTLTIVDSDPIDIAVSSNKISLLKHAVPFSDSLYLFSELTQFKLTSGNNLLTPETVNIANTTEFEASLKTKPQAVGKFVYFASRRGEFGSIWEYFVDSDTDTNDALEVTSHVPYYIDGEITNIQSSSNDSMLIVQSDGSSSELYIYRFFWVAKDKVQSAWSKWTFSGDVLDYEFNKSELSLLVKYSDGLYLERMSFTEDSAKAYTANFEILLDRRFLLKTLSDVKPYSDSSLIFVNNRGKIIEESTINAEITAGRVVFGGIPYTFKYRLSQPFLKNENQPILTGSLRIRNYSIYYSNTAYFKVRVIPLKRIASGSGETSYDKEFNGRIVGLLSNALNSSPTETGLFKVACMSNSDAVAVEIVNDSHFPCEFLGADWEAQYTIRSQRM